VQDSRRRIWVEAKTRCFDSFEELNCWRRSKIDQPYRLKIDQGI
jgi:hypothetical protein